jgi:hypothetical protein
MALIFFRHITQEVQLLPELGHLMSKQLDYLQPPLGAHFRRCQGTIAPDILCTDKPVHFNLTQSRRWSVERSSYLRYAFQVREMNAASMSSVSR